MRHAELLVFETLLAILSLATAGSCWGIWRLHAEFKAFRQHLFAYRADLD